MVAQPMPRCGCAEHDRPVPAPGQRAPAGVILPRMTCIHVDGDACPVRDEVFRVATRLNLPVVVVSNGSRPIRPPELPNVRMVTVAEGADRADDWIVEHIARGDV